MTVTASPVSVTAAIPRESSRLWALLLVLFGLKSFALIIHYIIAFFWAIAVFVVFFLSQLVVVFTARYPEGMHAFVARFVGWNNEINGWFYGLTDRFPPFVPSDEDYPVTTAIARPDTSSRGWAALTIFLLKFLALIPHFIVLYVLSLAQIILVFVANVIILFTGSFPDSLFDFVVGVLRWQTRVTAFAFGLDDQYPPFTLS